MRHILELSSNFQFYWYTETSEGPCPEEELQRLVSLALEQNPKSQRLKEALVKQSWDGTVTSVHLQTVNGDFSCEYCFLCFIAFAGEKFAGSVDRRMLAKDISEIVKKM